MKQQRLAVMHKLMARYGEQNWWNGANPLADLVSMILIQQTTADNAQKALNNLTEHLTLARLLALSPDELQMRIRPAGFYKQKSRYIKGLIEWLDAHGGDFTRFEQVPTAQLRQGLLKLHGVGAETADVMLLYIFKRKVFVADQYALRLCHRLGLSHAKSYETLRAEWMPLMAEISLKTAQEWHAVIDEHGKCYRRNPDLDESWLLE